MSASETDFAFPSILMPWETFSDQAAREARERESGERWTEGFLREVEGKVRGYEHDLDAGWCERMRAVSMLNAVYRNVPYHMRGELFGARALEVMGR